MFILRIIIRIIFNDGFKKTKTKFRYVMSDIIFIIFELFLQSIYIDKSIVIANFFKSSKPPIYLTHYYRNRILKT